MAQYGNAWQRNCELYTPEVPCVALFYVFCDLLQLSSPRSLQISLAGVPSDNKAWIIRSVSVLMLFRMLRARTCFM